ncbi:MAG: hypothetical protein ACJZ0Y_03195 [Cytophagales bacterium]
MKYFLSLFIFSLSFSTYSQSPQGFNYQAIVRDAAGNIRSNQGVQFVFEIQDVTGNSVYTESHTIVTNKYGLADGIVIGKGSTIDNFAAIEWGNGAFYVNVKVDGVDMGSSQLMSVPYALYALKAGTGGGGGVDGVGIESTIDNGDGTFTLKYTDGTSFTTTNFTGPDGSDGKTVLSGVFDPTLSDGVDGDFYINTSSNKIFGPKKIGTTPSGWSTGVSIIGDKGDKGDKGDSGDKGDKGDKGDTGDAGVKGDKGDTGEKGDKGDDGSGGFLSGTSDPGSSDGVDGDFYINTATSKIFGPKASSNWPSGISLLGATGDAGAKGDKGDTGDAGAKGDKGDTGDKGDSGVDGEDGSGGFLSGTSDPGSSDGVDGDFYINTSTSKIFGAP